MKVFKRNAVVIAVLLFVCAAVYLNWLYNKKEADVETDAVSDSDTADAEANSEDTTDVSESSGLYYTDSGDASSGASSTSDEVSEYFAEVRLNRQTARDEAKETLTLVTETDGAAEETVTEALNSLTQIADWTIKEAELESLIIGKGFSDCVVYMTDDGVTVTVAVGDEGLSSAGAAQITELITSDTEYTAADLKIIEIK